jgi:hypothetical protein
MTMNLATLNDGTLTYAATEKDAAGNTGTAATTSDRKDTVAPAVTITAPMYVNKSTAASVQVNGTTDAGTSVTVTVRDSAFKTITAQAAPSGTSWTATLNLSTLGEGTLTYTAATTDTAGNSTTATAAGATSKDTVAPSVTGVKLANGGSTNTNKASADVGDTVTLTYSEKMDLTKFCPGWTGSSLSGTATISDTGNDDTLTFGFSSCTLGTVALGGNYLTGPNASFGVQGTASTVSWDSTNNALVITFGNAPNGGSGSGTLNAGVPAGQPTYYPPQTALDAAGNVTSTTSFTAVAGAKSGLG